MKNIQAAVADVWANGGKGALDLAQLVIDSVNAELSDFKPLYDWNSPVLDKISKIAQEIYGAIRVEYAAKAMTDYEGSKI